LFGHFRQPSRLAKIPSQETGQSAALMTSMFNLAAILIALLVLCVMILRWGMPRHRSLSLAFVLGAWASAYLTFRLGALPGIVDWQ
jgi:hypothetical protein